MAKLLIAFLIATSLFIGLIYSLEMQLQAAALITKV